MFVAERLAQRSKFIGDFGAMVGGVVLIRGRDQGRGRDRLKSIQVIVLPRGAVRQYHPLDALSSGALPLYCLPVT